MRLPSDVYIPVPILNTKLYKCSWINECLGLFKSKLDEKHFSHITTLAKGILVISPSFCGFCLRMGGGGARYIYLRMYMKEDNPGPKCVKGGNSREIIIYA